MNVNDAGIAVIPIKKEEIPGAVPFAVTICLFFLWGMAHNLNDILIAQFKRAFSLSNSQASLVQSAFYCAYLVMPLPVSIVMNSWDIETPCFADSSPTASARCCSGR